MDLASLTAAASAASESRRAHLAEQLRRAQGAPADYAASPAAFTPDARFSPLAEALNAMRSPAQAYSPSRLGECAGRRPSGELQPCAYPPHFLFPSFLNPPNPLGPTAPPPPGFAYVFPSPPLAA